MILKTSINKIQYNISQHITAQNNAARHKMTLNNIN